MKRSGTQFGFMEPNQINFNGSRVKRFGAQLIWSLVIPAVFITVWYLIANHLQNPVVLPHVRDLVQLLIHPADNLISMGSLLNNIFVSLVRVLIGFILAVLIAVPAGIAMGYYDSVYRLFNGFLGMFRPIPPLAWVPLVLAWFGITSMATLLGVKQGQWYIYLNNLKLSMVFIIFIGAFYPVLTSSLYGVRNVRKVLLDSARVLGANEKDIFRLILLPAVSPSIVNGMRIGLGVAWMCLVSAEMLPGSLSGVGYLITHAYTVARTDIVIAGMVSIGVVGAVLDFLFRILEDKKFAWQRLSR
ncbi:MAG: ABC transporter permease [Desulfotomaculaceae bacterium]|nr:ABC transporter permease [Desulfotomaculaceae bacterium]